MDKSSRTMLIFVVFNVLAVSGSRAMTVDLNTTVSTTSCSWGFQCVNGRCVDNLLKCDGEDDCGDMSDEKNCTCTKGTFPCHNGRCVDLAWVCDGEDDCNDNSDEYNCSVNDPCYQNGDCDHICIPVNSSDGTLTGKKCVCKTGYYLREDKKTCADVDECVSKDICSGRCYNTHGSYYCDCANGFKIASDMKTCIDVNECDLNNGECEHLCKNTYGSYLCECKSGYYETEVNPRHCHDIDECGDGVPDCHLCHNVAGGFTCECDKGYMPNNNQTKCLDLDECKIKNGGCDQICINERGSYKCACKQGYKQTSPQSKRCIDINECEKNNGKGPCQIGCINDRGSYRCVCERGFKLDVDGKSCTDINECKLPGKSLCDHTCMNTYGSYYCTCNPNFFLASDGKTCRDSIDFSECGISGGLILETPQWEETQPNNWPWTVHFVASFSWISMPIDGCLGVILSKNLIITAAHCFSGLESTHVKVITNAGETLKVKRIIKHHSFDLKSGKADIALIKLAKTLNFSLKVRPICLPKKTDLMKALRDNSKTLGMVLLRDESKLKKKTVRIGTAKHCTKKKFFHGGMICAGSKQDECTGDSGAPLMFTMWRRDKQHIKYLGGILSWGRDQFEEECDSELSYVAYNSLQRYLGWILHHIGRN